MRARYDEINHRPIPPALLDARGEATVFKRLAQDETAATAIEYGLIVALIAIAMVVAAQALGLNLANVFTTASTAMAGKA